MNAKELTRMVALGEGTHIEFKRRVPQPKRLAKEVIAFANSRGGHVLLGVDDDGSILGVRDASEEEFAMQEALSLHCAPPIAIRAERVPISRKRDVIVVEVPQSDDKPHFLVDPEDGKHRTAYVRVDDMSIEASREAVRLMRAEQQPADVKFEFGDKELKLMRYLDTYGRITVGQFARLADIPPRRASQTLVLLAKARILRLNAHPQQDYFTLA